MKIKTLKAASLMSWLVVHVLISNPITALPPALLVFAISLCMIEQHK